MNRIQSIQDIVDWGLCIGCGACYAVCPKGAVRLFDVESAGIRPRIDTARCGTCTDCLDACPGYAREYAGSEQGGGARFDADLGPVMEIWEGYAAHSQYRYRGASGGVMSALALYCIEREDMSRVIQTGMDRNAPWRTRTYLNDDRESILQCAGSRYAPASPCAVLKKVENLPGSSVFLGKPCDAAAVANMCRRNGLLRNRIGLVITHFCAGTPSTRGTLDVLSHLGMPYREIGTLRYRGYGWPGNFTSTDRENMLTCTLPYRDLWSILQHYCPLACRLCPDGTGWFGDIACGDAWHRSGERSIGHSLMVVRTAEGRRILRKAIEDRYIIAWEVPSETVVKSQQALLRKRRVLYGRLRALNILGIPVTGYRGFKLAEYWKQLPLGNKLKEIIGTWKRVLLRKLWRPRPVALNEPSSPLDVESWIPKRTVPARTESVPTLNP